MRGGFCVDIFGFGTFLSNNAAMMFSQGKESPTCIVNKGESHLAEGLGASNRKTNAIIQSIH